MNIEKHGNRWRVQEYYKGNRYRITLDYEPTPKEAQRLIDIEIGQGDYRPKSGMTMRSACLEYIDKRKNTLSPSTIIGYQGIIRRMSGHFADLKIDQITNEDVQEEIDLVIRYHSPKTQRNVYGLIKRVLSIYRKDLRIDINLSVKDKFEPYTPIDDDIARILSYVKGSDYEIAFNLGANGLRRGEICALTSKDLEGNTLTINKSLVLTPEKTWVIKNVPKTTDSIRKIEIDDYLADLIRKKEGKLFDKYPERLNKHLGDVQKKLGIPHFRFHDLRAYCASAMHEQGIADIHIQKYCGWGSRETLHKVYERQQSDKAKIANQIFTSHLVSLRDA